jgi:hypothetical protein
MKSWWLTRDVRTPTTQTGTDFHCYIWFLSNCLKKIGCWSQEVKVKVKVPYQKVDAGTMQGKPTLSKGCWLPDSYREAASFWLWLWLWLADA